MIPVTTVSFLYFLYIVIVYNFVTSPGPRKYGNKFKITNRNVISCGGKKHSMMNNSP